jgi:cytochrome c553
VLNRPLIRGGATALLVLALLGCNDRPDTTIAEPPQPTMGAITGAVSWGSIMVQGVALSLSNGRSTVTGANGAFTFTDVVPGSYVLTIDVPAQFELPSGEAATKPVTVTAGQTATVHFSVVEAAMDLSEGERLFDHETFGGNGRTCGTCHMPATGTITLQAIAERLAASPNDPLFRHDATDNGTSGTQRLLMHGTIRVELALPDHVTLASNPSQRTIVVHRGVPTTINAPALDGMGHGTFMYDLRHSNLTEQALDALSGHAQSTIDATGAQLQAIVAFQQRADRFFSSEALRLFASGGAPPALPTPLNESESRGLTFFESVAPVGKAGACAVCHSGPNLNEVNEFGPSAVSLARGAKFGNVRVAERNATQNQLLTFRVDNGGGIIRTVTISDPGIMLTSRSSNHVRAMIPANRHPADLAGSFKTPSLWGVRNTPPYFHDNSAKTLRDVIEHYALFFFPDLGIVLTEQDKSDILAFLERL